MHFLEGVFLGTDFWESLPSVGLSVRISSHKLVKVILCVCRVSKQMSALILGFHTVAQAHVYM